MIQRFRVKNPVKFRGMTAVSCWDSFENQDDKNASYPGFLGVKPLKRWKKFVESVLTLTPQIQATVGSHVQ